MSLSAPRKSAFKSQTRHAGNAGEVKTIAHAAQFCLESFDVCLVIAGKLGPQDFALIQNQLGRLSLWISNIGAFALDRASIDHRLRDVPDTHRLVKGLVEVLNGNLRKCIPKLETLTNLTRAATASDTSKERIETEQLEFESSVQQVANDISLLYQLSNTIRRAGRESQNSKAISLFTIKDAEGNNIEKILEARFLQNLTDKFPGCDEKLRQRLATTILLRRKRILYRRSRRPKASATRLPIVAEPEVHQISGTERILTSVETNQQETGPAETHTLKRKPSMVRSHARTTKTTTTLDLEKLRLPTAPSVLSVTKTIPMNSHDDLVFPPPPRAAVLQRFRELKASRRARHEVRLREIPNFELYVFHNGKPPSLSTEDILTLQNQIEEAERDLKIGIDTDLKTCKDTETEVLCPYCLYALSSTDMKSKGKWRDHLRGDLDAYVCLFEDCENPHELYSHSDTWLKHMRQHAVRWQCVAKSHGPQIFDQSKQYQRHLRESHKGVFSDSQVSALTERNARMMGPLFQSCPLCGITKDDPTVTGRLEHHVVGHLRYLALSSLPYIEEEEQKTNSTNSLRSDDSAKPADRSTVHDMLDQAFDFAFEDGQDIVASEPANIHSDKDPYAAWNGIQHYVQETHTLRPGEPPKQILKSPSDNFPCPVIPESRDDYAADFEQYDDSLLFVDCRGIPEGSSGRRAAQWGWIPMITIPYEGQQADPILEEFRRRAVSMLETEPTTSCGTSLPASGSAPVRQRILQRFTSATVSPPHMPAFVPMDTLTELINVETISMALIEVGRHDVGSKQCGYIAASLPRIFATLLLSENVEAILEFELRNFTDNLFPLLRADAPPEGRETEFTAWHSTIYPLIEDLNGGIHPVSTCFHNPSIWSLDKFERFYNSQWLFSAPVFGSTKFEYLLAEEIPLPLTTLTPRQVEGELFFNQVYMATIHPAHMSWQNSIGTEPLEVVIKAFEAKTIRREDTSSSGNSSSRADNVWPPLQLKPFLDECDVLYAMRKIEHPHLLQAIAAFTRRGQIGFIMPRARGSLRTFCETQDHSMCGPETTFPWLFTQIFGIADGLAKLHEKYFGFTTRHSTLSPDNILWFPGPESDPDTHALGIFIIGDTRRMQEPSEETSCDRSAELRYMARERPRSLHHDGWSLGLIFFELVIWLIRGNREVQEFRSQTSKLYLWDGDDYKLEEWSSILMNDERCLPDMPLGQLVKFIVRKLLVPFGPAFQEKGRARLSEFCEWVSLVRSAVSASGLPYTAVQPDLPELPPPRSYKQGRQNTLESPEGDSRLTFVSSRRSFGDDSLDSD